MFCMFVETQHAASLRNFLYFPFFHSWEKVPVWRIGAGIVFKKVDIKVPMIILSAETDELKTLYYQSSGGLYEF